MNRYCNCNCCNCLYWFCFLPRNWEHWRQHWMTGNNNQQLETLTLEAVTSWADPQLPGNNNPLYCRQPDADSRRQTAGGRQPEADSRRQTAGGRQLEADSRRQTAGGRQPDADSQMQTAKNSQPKEAASRWIQSAAQRAGRYGPHTTFETIRP